MTKTSDKILQTIKEKHIQPEPRWHFLARRRAFLGLLVISVLLGSLSFSVIMHITDFADLSILIQTQGNILTSTVMMLPYFWLFSVALFALVAYYNWKHTRLGYRLKRRWIVLGSIFVSIFFGSILYAFGMGEQMDNIMAENMPIYDQSRRDARTEIWMRPDSGLLVGKVMELDVVEDNIIIKDENGQNWKIEEKNIQQTVKNTLRKGKIIKIIGTKDGEHKFDAREIRRCGDCQHDEDNDEDDEDGKDANDSKREARGDDRD